MSTVHFVEMDTDLDPMEMNTDLNPVELDTDLDRDSNPDRQALDAETAK